MSYKVCTRCQFVVPGKKKICMTCGNKKLQGDSTAASSAKTVTAERGRPTMVAVTNTVYSSARSTAQATAQVTAQATAQASGRATSQYVVAEEAGVPARLNSLREKFSFEEEELPTLWWTETVSKVRKALNI